MSTTDLSTSSSAVAFKRMLGESFGNQQLAIPPVVEQISPEQLAEILLRDASANGNLVYRVVDVRQPEEFEAGRIAGSLNIPIDTFDGTELAQWISQQLVAGLSPFIVFVSAQSPDIDVSCALTLIEAWESLGLQNVHNNASATTWTATLLGGLYYWLQLYSDNSTLTESFRADKWATTLSVRPE